MNSITIYGAEKAGKQAADAITKAATLRGKATVIAGIQIRGGLVILGWFVGVVYPLLTWVLS